MLNRATTLRFGSESDVVCGDLFEGLVVTLLFKGFACSDGAVGSRFRILSTLRLYPVCEMMPVRGVDVLFAREGVRPTFP